MPCSEENLGFTKLVLISILEEKNNIIRSKIFSDLLVFRKDIEGFKDANAAIFTNLLSEIRQTDSDYDLEIYIWTCLSEAADWRWRCPHAGGKGCAFSGFSGASGHRSPL